jgi:hypothetical protein
MSLPSFFSRVADSLRPVAEVDADTLAAKLEEVRIQLHLHSTDPAAIRAYLLAVNLAARLYPRIDLFVPRFAVADEVGGHTRGSDGAPPAGTVADQGRLLALRINPNATVHVIHGAQDDDASINDGEQTVLFALGQPEPGTTALAKTVDGSSITASASGWSVFIDADTTAPAPASDERLEGTEGSTAGHPVAWLAAAAFGMSEVFRRVFATELGPRGRQHSQPGSLNLLTGRPFGPDVPLNVASETANTEPDPSAGCVIDVGEVYLIGAGAIGQAAVYALASVTLQGTLHIVDPETVTLSNLQRYVLTDDASVGSVKADLARDALAPGAEMDSDGPTLSVRPFQGRWGDDAAHIGVERVLVALDTPHDRIAVAASLPHYSYNAWTQVTDLGWSRHEQFGIQPCLACLYYPDRRRPSEHELIAAALDQHPLRVLGYLTHGVPIGMPLPDIPNLATIQAPPDSERWKQVSLMTDLVTAGAVGEDEQSTWSDKTIGAVYRDGICAGGLLPVGDVAQDVLVPLAHQSALAGVMLAAELIWSVTPELKALRDEAVEHRFDVLRGFPQIVARPRTITYNCLCSDRDYLEARARRHPSDEDPSAATEFDDPVRGEPDDA